MTPSPVQLADAPKRRIGLRKRFLFGLVILGFLYGIAEAGSLAVFWAVEGKCLTPARMRARLQEVALGQASALDAGMSGETPPVIHPYLGYVLDPRYNSDAYLAHHGCPVNDYGFLDSADPIHKRSRDRVVIGITGGSVAYYFSVQGTPGLERELKKSPAFADKEIVWVRMALGGYKQPQQLMALNYLLALGAEFDILINIDGFNEVALSPIEDIALGVNPSFPRLWNQLVVGQQDLEVRRRSGKITCLRETRTQWAEQFCRLPCAYSPSLFLIWKVRDHYLNRALAQETQLLQSHVPETNPYCARGPKTHLAGDEAMYAAIADLWKQSSLQLERTCRANGIRYYHFLQPNQYVAGSKPMGAEERKVAYLEGHLYGKGVVNGYPWLRRKSTELLAEGVRFRDLSMVFATVEEALYVDNACHFNARGNEIMAPAIAEAILRRDGRGFSSNSEQFEELGLRQAGDDGICSRQFIDWDQ